MQIHTHTYTHRHTFTHTLGCELLARTVQILIPQKQHQPEGTADTQNTQWECQCGGEGMVRGIEFPFLAVLIAFTRSRHGDCYLQATDHSGHHILGGRCREGILALGWHCLIKN